MNHEAFTREARLLVLPSVDNALNDWVASIERDIALGRFTELQVLEAVSGYPDFEDAWDERPRDDS